MADYHVTLYSGPETPGNESQELQWARNYLKQMGVQYEEKNILDPGARGELIHHTNSHRYPAINVNGHFVSGFFKEKWDHLLMHNAVGRT